MAKITGTHKIKLGIEGSIIQVEQQGKDLYLKTHFKLGPMKAPPESWKQSFAKKDVTGEEGATGEQLYTPKSEDLIRVPFRALSATVVAGGTWRATDFTDESVLRASIPKLIGKTAFTEHWQYALNNIGVVEAASWSAQTTQGGIIVPGGIDVIYLIDAKRNEELARSLLLPVPAIYSNSVTVEYAWEPTHDDFTDADDFERNIGKVGADKRMIARKATEIIDYHESSILWMGADPFAKMYGPDGKLINIDEGAVYDQVNQYTKDAYKKDHFYFASYSFRKENINLKQQVEQNETVMDKILLEAVKVALGLAKDAEVTAAHISQFAEMKLVKSTDHSVMVTSLTKVTELEKEIGELKGKGTDPALKTANETLTKEKGELEKAKGELEKKVTDMEPLYKLGETAIGKMRKEVERLYRTTLKEGQSEDKELLEKFGKAEEKELNTFLNLFAKGTAEKFEAHCEECSSTKVSIRSTFATEDPAGGPTTVKRPHLAQMVRK